MSQPVYIPSPVRLMGLLGDLCEVLAEVGHELLPAETEALTLHAQALAASMETIAGRAHQRRRLLESHRRQVRDLARDRPVAFRARHREDA